MVCKLDNGSCGFSPKACVGGDKPGMCGINFDGPGTCSDSEKKNCWNDQDCGKGQCTAIDTINGYPDCDKMTTKDACNALYGKCQWTGPTCQSG